MFSNHDNLVCAFVYFLLVKAINSHFQRAETEIADWEFCTFEIQIMWHIGTFSLGHSETREFSFFLWHPMSPPTGVQLSPSGTHHHSVLLSSFSVVRQLITERNL